MKYRDRTFDMSRPSHDRRDVTFMQGFIHHRSFTSIIAGLVFAANAAPAASSDIIRLQVNGKYLTLSQAPLEKGDRVFVPLRVIFETLGATVDYNGGTIVATRDRESIQLLVGSSAALVNGRLEQIAVSPFVIDSRVMVPLRFVSEALKATVDYNAPRRVVVISQDGISDVASGPPPSVGQRVAGVKPLRRAATEDPQPKSAGAEETPQATQVLVDTSSGSRYYGRETVSGHKDIFIDCHPGRTIAINPVTMHVADWPAETCVADSLSDGVPGIDIVPEMAPTNSPSSPAGLDTSQYYEVVSRNSGKALDVNGGPCSAADGARIQQWTYVGAANQEWRFVPDPSGGYVIVAKSSGKAIDILDDRRDEGAPIHQWQRHQGISQRWLINPVGNGFYKIISKMDGLALDVTGGVTANGVRIVQWHYANNFNQQWKLVPVQSTTENLQSQPCGVQVAPSPPLSNRPVVGPWLSNPQVRPSLGP